MSASYEGLRYNRQFIKEFLPKELSSQIDLNGMKPIPTEKVKGYNKYYMDTAVECKIADTKGQLCFVFEHKSYPDPGVLLQLLKIYESLQRIGWRNLAATEANNGAFVSMNSIACVSNGWETTSIMSKLSIITECLLKGGN